MGHAVKRSGEPPFWALFGAGGMLSALIGPVLIFMTGIAMPLRLLPAHTLSYAHVLAFARNPAGKIAIFAVISLFLFHGCHRMVHSLHDLGIRTGPTARMVFYGAAAFGSFIALALLMRIWF